MLPQAKKEGIQGLAKEWLVHRFDYKKPALPDVHGQPDTLERANRAPACLTEAWQQRCRDTFCELPN